MRKLFLLLLVQNPLFAGQPLLEHAPALGAARISGRDVLLDIKDPVGQEFNYIEGMENLLQSLANGFV